MTQTATQTEYKKPTEFPFSKDGRFAYLQQVQAFDYTEAERGFVAAHLQRIQRAASKILKADTILGDAAANLLTELSELNFDDPAWTPKPVFDGAALAEVVRPEGNKSPYFLSQTPEEQEALIKEADNAVYSIKKLQLHNGHEGQGYNLDLYRNKKFLCHVIDEGNGGCPFFGHEMSSREHEILRLWCLRLPKWKMNDMEFDCSVDMAISYMVSAAERPPRTPKKVLARIPGRKYDSPDQYSVFSTLPYNDESKAKLKAKFGDGIVYAHELMLTAYQNAVDEAKKQLTPVGSCRNFL